MPDNREMWLSTRATLRPGDPEWDSYIQFIGLPHLREVRTIDSACNPCRNGHEPVYSIDELWERMGKLPRLTSDREYHLLFMDALALGAALRHPCLELLGYDLSDDFWTSSLLNCGRWQGVLEPIARRAGDNGLLTLEDAKLAQALLPGAWNDDPHSFVTVWALFEVVPQAEVADA